MAEREPTPARLIVTLGLTGLVSGVVLVGVYLTTLPRIQRNQAEALRAAVFRVLPGTTTLATLVVRDGRLVVWDGPANTLPDEQAVYAGYAEDERLVGYAIPADGPGFMDTIKLIFGYDPSRRVIIGMQVLDSRETPGLGDKIITDPAFQENFRALEIEPEIVPVKRGKKENANEVDCISGATISSEAVVGILNDGARRWVPILPDSADPAAAGDRRETSPSAGPDDTSEVTRHVPRAAR